MSVKRLVVTFLMICLIAWPMLRPAFVSAEPSTQGECSGNVLLNPSFEEGFSDRGAGEVSVANGWYPWYQDGPGQVDGYNRRPEYKPEDASRFGRRRVRTGNFAQKFFSTFATHNAGLLQQVQVPVGSQLTFSAWVQVWSSQDPNPDTVVSPGNYRVSIGIDPTGGTDWSSPNVAWTEPRMEYNTWMRLEIRSVAKAGTATVFLRGNPEFRNRFNDSYWDDACLTVVRPTPRPTNTPKHTATPTSTPTPQASPTPTLTPTPMPGGICVSVYADSNGNGIREEGENLVAGAIITLFDSNRLELEKYTTDGLSEPFCLGGLAAGTYYLKRQNSPGYVSTVPDDWGIAVVAGGNTNVELGCQFVPAPSATPTATRTPTPTPTSTPKPVLREMGRAVYQISGILAAALALIIPIGLRYLRKFL